MASDFSAPAPVITRQVVAFDGGGARAARVLVNARALLAEILR